VLLYQMLTGRLPFEGDAIDQVRSHLVEPVPALERTSPSRRLDTALEGVIRRAMAKRREERFEHAREMLEALAVIRRQGAGTLPPTAASKTQALLTARRALPPIGQTLRWLRVLCVFAVIVQLFVILLLVRDAEGRAALVHVGKRSGVALTSFSERSLYWGSRFAAWARSLPESQRERSGEPPPVPPSEAGPSQPLAAAVELPSSEPPPTAATVAGATAQAVAPPSTAGSAAPVRPEVSPDAEPGATIAEALPLPAAAPSPPTAATPIAAVPGPPKPRNPWTRGAPAELRGIRKSILAGGIGDDRVAGTLRTYSQSHPGDPRGQLLLGMMYLNRNWRSDAVAQFASAIKTDLSARGAPEVLDSLLDLVASGRSEAEASSLITRAYGSEALPALTARITATRQPDAAARLRALRARLDRAR
jgi:serine/threonine protein kinase